MKPTLVVLAAGMGSRYGGLKQADPVGPSGEAILDYSVFDALRGGFGKVVFVIRHDFEAEFKEKIGTGKFLLCHWDGTQETEQKIKDETKATIRCIPVDSFVCEEEGKDIYSGKPSKQRVVFAISY